MQGPHDKQAGQGARRTRGAARRACSAQAQPRDPYDYEQRSNL